MPLYEYKCPLGHITAKFKAMNDYNKPVKCDCGLTAERILSPCNATFGWRLTESSHIKGNPDQLERAI